jgi:hypothetical protein
MYMVNVVDALDPSDTLLSYATYKVCDMTYHVGSRPNSHKVTREFFNSIDGWISVTDTPVWFNEKVNQMWFPWDEGKHCPPEVLYSVIRTLQIWETMRHLKTFYIHCDAGTHRAPTVFGAWLVGRYGRVKAAKIVKEVVLVNRKDLSDPVEYIGHHLHDIPEDLVLIKLTAQTVLNRYDGIIGTMKRRFDRRYLSDRDVYRHNKAHE